MKLYYDRSGELRLTNPWYREQVERYLLGALHSDATTDVTTKKLIGRTQRCQAVIRAQQASVIAGLEEITWLLRHEDIVIKRRTPDGTVVKRQQIILHCVGRARSILAVERTIVNTVQRLSGVATATAAIVQRVGKKPLICATRKTAWGALDKRAVQLGGGYTHRLGLFDGVLVKDNHLALTDHDTLKRSHWGKQLLQLEVASFAELKRAVVHYPQFTILLLDNFSVERLRLAARWLEKQRLRRRYILEASGGINLNNVQAYAKTGVDALSIGWLTHSAPALDLSLECIP